MQPEILEYFKGVAARYEIEDHVRFESVLESAHWDEVTGTWLASIRDVTSEMIVERRSKILVSAVGALSVPKKCDLPGASTFKGSMFHSARWDHSFNWEGKEVVVVGKLFMLALGGSSHHAGNGCSATQIVPAISDGKGAIKKVTQFSRQAHWLAERPNPKYSRLFKWTMRWIPFAMKIYRAMIYWEKERDFGGFDLITGAITRAGWSNETAKYIRKNSPAKYRNFLVPKTEVGCKRRVNDTGYLACLHRDNVELVHDDPIKQIEEDRVRTSSGRNVHADAIVLAHGFETQEFLSPIEIYGKDGESLNEHVSCLLRYSPK